LRITWPTGSSDRAARAQSRWARGAAGTADAVGASRPAVYRPCGVLRHPKHECCLLLLLTLWKRSAVLPRSYGQRCATRMAEDACGRHTHRQQGANVCRWRRILGGYCHVLFSTGSAPGTLCTPKSKSMESRSYGPDWRSGATVEAAGRTHDEPFDGTPIPGDPCPAPPAFEGAAGTPHYNGWVDFPVNVARALGCRGGRSARCSPIASIDPNRNKASPWASIPGDSCRDAIWKPALGGAFRGPSPSSTTSVVVAAAAEEEGIVVVVRGPNHNRYLLPIGSTFPRKDSCRRRRRRRRRAPPPPLFLSEALLLVGVLVSPVAEDGLANTSEVVRAPCS
jgi:hypothetical protein